MTDIKRGTTPTITVMIDGIAIEDIEKIEFIFKQYPKESVAGICYKNYPSEDVAFDSESGYFLVTLTEDETRAFKAGNTIYMDTRITLTNGCIPATEIVQFNIIETLFKRSSI